jgi:hypothetical protein
MTQAAARSVVTPTASEDIAGWIASFESGADALTRWTAGLTRAQLLATPVPGTWSMQTLIVHMLESDLAAVHRMRRVVAEEVPLLIAYDETLAAKRLAYEQADARQVCELFRATRLFAASWLRTVSPSDFARVGVHNQRGKVSLLDFVKIYVEHVQHHERFAQAKRRALGV